MSDIKLDIAYIEQMYNKYKNYGNIENYEKENILKMLDNHKSDCKFKGLLSAKHGGNFFRELQRICKS